MKLDKKNIIVIILMVLFIMILGIKYYVDISAKKGFNPNEVDTPVKKKVIIIHQKLKQKRNKNLIIKKEINQLVILKKMRQVYQKRIRILIKIQIIKIKIILYQIILL